MAKKHQLGPPAMPDAGILGIVCQFPDYRLVHFMNKVLQFNLARIQDLVITDPAGGSYGRYSHFYWHDTEYDIRFSLLSNKDQGVPLFPVLKNIDFLLFMMGLNERYDVERVVRELRSVNGVMMVQQIPPAKIPRIEDYFGLIEFQIDDMKTKK